MPSTPPGIGQPTRETGTGREDRGQRGNKWWTLVAACLGTFVLLDITIVNVALPDIQRVLHSSFADLQCVVDAYALTWRRSCSRRAASRTSTAAACCT